MTWKKLRIMTENFIFLRKLTSLTQNYSHLARNSTFTMSYPEISWHKKKMWDYWDFERYRNWLVIICAKWENPINPTNPMQKNKKVCHKSTMESFCQSTIQRSRSCPLGLRIIHNYQQLRKRIGLGSTISNNYRQLFSKKWYIVFSNYFPTIRINMELSLAKW